MDQPVTLVPPCEEVASYQTFSEVWLALWSLITRADDIGLSDEQKELGISRSGIEVTAPQAERIADRLEHLLETGVAQLYVAEYEPPPPQPCDICKGTGKAPSSPLGLAFPNGSCVACLGKGLRRLSASPVRFSKTSGNTGSRSRRSSRAG